MSVLQFQDKSVALYEIAEWPNSSLDAVRKLWSPLQILPCLFWASVQSLVYVFNFGAVSG